MNIQTKIKRFTDGSKATKAFADVVIDNKLKIRNVRILENEKGRFLDMPFFVRKDDDTGEKKRFSVVFPISEDARAELEDAVFAAYDAAKMN